MEIDPFIFRLSIFILSIFIGYYVVWSVTPSLTHSPNVCNQCNFISYYCWCYNCGISRKYLKIFLIPQVFLDFLAIFLAAINIFGGFLVTQRMLANV